MCGVLRKGNRGHQSKDLPHSCEKIEASSETLKHVFTNISDEALWRLGLPDEQN